MKKKVYLLFVLALLVLACKNKSCQSFRTEPIKLNINEISALGITSFEVFPEYKNDTIYIKGFVTSIPEEIYSVCLPLPGCIKKSYRKKGEYIEKNEKLALLEHQSYLELKSNYLKAAVRLKNLEENYERQGELALEQATSLKKMQQAEFEYKNAAIDYQTLLLKLASLGIDVEKLSVDNMDSEAYLLAPVSGYVENECIIPGTYYTNETIIRIVTQSEQICQFKINQTIAQSVFINQSLRLMSAGINFEGKLISIDSANNTGTSNLIIKYSENIKLKADESVQLCIPIKSSFFKIPKSSVINKQYCVFQSDINHFLLKELEILLEDNTYYYIKNGDVSEQIKIVDKPSKKLINLLKNY